MVVLDVADWTERVAVERIAVQRLGMQHELPAFGALTGGPCAALQIKTNLQFGLGVRVKRRRETMTIKRKPRGRPFQPGNPGRPLGSKNKTTQILEVLAEGEAEQVVQTVLQKAKAGNEACLRMLMDRVWPPRKGQPVKLEMAPLKTSSDVRNAITSLWNGMGEGRLTPDEAGALLLVAERSMQVINQSEVLKRIEALEKEKELRDAKANFETS